jgi:hypothetical protein
MRCAAWIKNLHKLLPVLIDVISYRFRALFSERQVEACNGCVPGLAARDSGLSFYFSFDRAQIKFQAEVQRQRKPPQGVGGLTHTLLKRLSGLCLGVGVA